MEILYLLIPLSIILIIIIAGIFIWSIQSGQYDDLDGPGYQILMDDDKVDTSSASNADHESDDELHAHATPSDATVEPANRNQSG